MASPSTLQPTLQQIDELDALLKQMLSLPAAPAEPDERPEIQDRESASGYHTETPAPLSPAGPAGAVALPAEPPNLEAKIDTLPLPASGSSSRFSAASSSAMPKNETKILNPPTVQSPMRFAPIPAPSPPAPVPSSLRSTALGRINRHFDRRMEPLGAWGRWLARPVGRNCLGIIGLLALAAAAALLLRDWVDWSR